MHMQDPSSIFIKPASGLRIADPKTGEYLPEGGMLMPRSGFWLRRLKDGDVIEVKQAAQAAKSAKKASDKE
jgi:hypothetical protein